MIDIHTHAIIDMIASRGQKEVVEWLKSYANLQVVSRDGSITYRKAISEAHPKAVQVSDRFHLYKNLTNYAIEYLKKQLKIVIKVALTAPEIKVVEIEFNQANENRKLTLEEKYKRILLLQVADKKSQTQICNELNMDVRSYKKLISATDIERQKMFMTIAAITHEERVENKIKLVNQIRKYKSQGLSKRAISRETGLSTVTITKYLDEKFNPVSSAYGKKKSSVLAPYYNEINALLNQGMMGSKVEDIIRSKGYDGSSSTVRHYISGWKKKFKNNIITNENPNPGQVYIPLRRNDIFKTLFKPISKIKGIDTEVFTVFCTQYPCFKVVWDLINSFRSMVKGKNSGILKVWIDKVRQTKIRELGSFVNGIERDYDAVINAIDLQYSNGLAEGSVNKIKVIKRVMYGRCSFETLRSKIIQLEKMRQIN